MSQPNILFLMTDQQRWDALSCATGANAWVHTPNLDRLAAEGIRFTRCVTNSPVCIPMRVSLATGRYPHNTHIWENMRHDMPPDTPTWMQAIRAAGYEPAAAEQAPDAERDRHEREPRALRRDLIFAAAFALPLLLISMTPMVLPGVRDLMLRLRPSPIWDWRQLALATPVLLWSGRRFVTRGWAELRHLTPGMDTLALPLLAKRGPNTQMEARMVLTSS